jgi:Putative undecaprenyl diphosphate synthase
VSATADVEHQLVHVAVAGGTSAEWDALDESQWDSRLLDLGKVADHIGASWVTIRPYEAGAPSPNPPASPRRVRTRTVGGCLVASLPHPDGRRRLVEVIAQIVGSGGEPDEAHIVAGINAPAEADPDLVVVLGPPNRLPPSLAWELAYSELVFLDVDWAHLQPDHLGEAISAFARRHRRFGGLD